MKIESSQLKAFTAALLAGTGVIDSDAAIVAEVIVAASLDGVDTHGISRLPIYLSRILNGRINACPVMTIEYTGASTAIVNGGNGLGQLIAYRSMEVAVELTKKTGIGCVAVCASNHYGASSYFCEMATQKNLIGMAFTNTPPAIAPWGGKRPYFGTNPVAFAFPTNSDPIIVDMASSVVARGNILKAAKEGRRIPEGWAIDAEGNPTTEAKQALAGAVLPMAGAKGYAMALIVEILAGVVAGAAIGKNVGWIYDDKTEPTNTGHFFAAFDIERFLPYPVYLARMESMVEEIRSIPLAEGIEKIFIPGERRKNIARLRKEQGIEVPGELVTELNEYALEFGAELLKENLLQS